MNLSLMLKKNNVTYNLRIAQVTGVLSAIFIQFLLDYKDAVKDKLLEGKYFILAKQQIAEATGLSDDNISKVESSLKDWNLIQINPVKNSNEKFYYSLDEELLLKVIGAEDREEVLNIVTKPGSKKPIIPFARQAPMSARQKGIQELKVHVANHEREKMVAEALIGWIDGVYGNPKGFLSKSGINTNIVILDAFCGGNIKQKLDILKIATIHGQRDLKWAIEMYNKEQLGKVPETVTYQESSKEY